jgi:hypothetical protein
MRIPVFCVLLDLLVPVLPSNETLERIHRLGRIDDSLSLCRETDESFAVLSERHDGRRRPLTLGILDDLGGLALHERDARVGGTEVNADHWAIDF